MRLICPLCGARDRREFTWVGAAELLPRPAPGGDLVAWLHLRENPAGPLDELWLHSAGCGALLRARRDTRSHATAGLVLAGGAR
ncbi:sarcosine oxidase subunit delta [Phaeovulum sp.]|jgi:sarcosine oxidase subunit delta|uniref:sarcosine oxidase subunit delta n=1 Tax=Phaeovulum sp. TaxID=2934796 RepID=UPI00272F11B1|nr:sarcosine oxidase subunit delta [Phaeovulum sp.]MDP1669885.1 sarcosine oxidase subunit delta [Phaeovulum sp.]MDP2063630.1 sarcosine oxidase subunit delta [Phaeovulum sp.]MDZ4118597.1 sarcosine oxidase subunit delta [Phaeovulum sp.]